MPNTVRYKCKAFFSMSIRYCVLENQISCTTGARYFALQRYFVLLVLDMGCYKDRYLTGLVPDILYY